MVAILKYNMTAMQNVYCSIAPQRSKIEIYQVDKSTRAASVKQANTRLETAICTANVMEEFQTWKQGRSKNAMFRYL